MLFHSKQLRHIIHINRYRLGYTYTILVLENMAYLILPYFLGKAINELIENEYKGFIIFGLAYFLSFALGVYRRRYDTRIFSRLYTDLIIEVIDKQKQSGTEISTISARSNLLKDVVNFLEIEVQWYCFALIQIVGSMCMLILYSPLIVGVCLLMLLPIMINNYLFAKRVKKVQNQYHNELERQVNVLSKENLQDVHAHYRRLRYWKIRISDLGSINYGITEMFILGVLLASLMMLREQEFAAGDFFGVYTYVYHFATGFNYLPDLIEKISQVRDIDKRIDHEIGEELALKEVF